MATEKKATQAGTAKRSAAKKPAAKRSAAKKPNAAARATTGPSPATRAATKPSAAKRVATKPSAAKRAATKPSAAKRAATKPSAAKRSATKRPHNVLEIGERLTRAIPEPELELAHQNAFQLLIATMLAAQSTDRTVNQVMPALLARYPDAHALAASEQEDVERLVLRTGFFRNKAKAIRGTAQALVARHGGQVPSTMEELVALPGVARKTANVVLGTAFRVAAGFIVDTHVMRVSQRLKLTRETDPVRIEADLCRLFPREQWIDMAHRFTLHGRYTCLAKEPLCGACPLNEPCPSKSGPAAGDWQERAAHESERARAGVRQSRGH